jgi:hypothetical protein
MGELHRPLYTGKKSIGMGFEETYLFSGWEAGSFPPIGAGGNHARQPITALRGLGAGFLPPIEAWGKDAREARLC